MFNYPIIVVGPPRSGTSTTAEILQHNFGVLMEMYRQPGIYHTNPDGRFEDLRLIEMNSLAERIGKMAWTRRFKRFIRSMSKTSYQWGFKDPRIIPILPYALSFFDHPTIIRCHRPEEKVVASYMRHFKWTEKESIGLYRQDERLLDRTLANINHIRFDFNEYISREKITEFLSGLELFYAT